VYREVRERGAREHIQQHECRGPVESRHREARGALLRIVTVSEEVAQLLVVDLEVGALDKHLAVGGRRRDGL
jgi:hypothetical protein